MNIKEYVYVSLLTAAAVVMGIIESSLPPFFAFAPGAKDGDKFGSCKFFVY